MIRLSQIAVVASLACLQAIAFAAPAAAQNGSTNAIIHSKPRTQNNQTTTPEIAPPPALPGALNPNAPADKTQLDLPPTEALFDAINRGDIASVRDAIARGADLNGRNVLGLSPVDLSIDLSRNDITFLLLSMRGPDGTLATVAKPGKPAQKLASAQAEAVKPQPPRPAPAQPSALKSALAVAKPSPASTPAPQRVSLPVDPGTPNPQAGFLGFGTTGQ